MGNNGVLTGKSYYEKLLAREEVAFPHKRLKKGVLRHLVSYKRLILMARNPRKRKVDIF